MELVITLRRTVTDTAQAEQLVLAVKGKLEDHPEIRMTSLVTEKITPEQ